MAHNNPKERNEFDGMNERDAMNSEYEKEKNTREDASPKASDELSTAGSMRNYGEVSGSTFGDESNTAKFSNMGAKNQERKGDGNSSAQYTSDSSRNSNRDSGYADELNKAQDDFISNTGPFSNRSDNATANE